MSAELASVLRNSKVTFTELPRHKSIFPDRDNRGNLPKKSKICFLTICLQLRKKFEVLKSKYASGCGGNNLLAF